MRVGARLASFLAAAAAALAGAFVAFPIADRFELFWPAFLLVFGFAGSLQVAVGFLAPNTGWAMAAPAPTLFAWIVIFFGGEASAPDDTGGPGPGAGIFLLFAVVAGGLGMALAGCIALGAWLRERRLASRARQARPAGPPYP